jgi:hypothetical protein
MNPASILQPLVFGGLPAVGLGLCLYLFITLKREMGGLLRRRGEEQLRLEGLEAALAQARLAVQSLETDLREVERQTGMLVAPAPARSGLNLSKRTQVLRMHRCGQDTAGIAAAMSLPRAEVELLIKVHRMVVQQI